MTVAFVIWLAVIGVSVVLGVLMIRECYDAAQHELVLDELWDSDDDLPVAA